MKRLVKLTSLWVLLPLMAATSPGWGFGFASPKCDIAKNIMHILNKAQQHGWPLREKSYHTCEWFALPDQGKHLINMEVSRRINPNLQDTNITSDMCALIQADTQGTLSNVLSNNILAVIKLRCGILPKVSPPLEPDPGYESSEEEADGESLPLSETVSEAHKMAMDPGYESGDHRKPRNVIAT